MSAHTFFSMKKYGHMQIGGNGLTLQLAVLSETTKEVTVQQI